MTHRREHAVLGGEVEEGEQRFPLFFVRQATALSYLAPYCRRTLDRRLGRRTGRRAVNLAKVGQFGAC